MKTRITRINPPDGVGDYLYYAGEDLEHNDLCYMGIDGLLYKVRNAMETYPPREEFNVIRVQGIDYEPIECGVCKKTYWVDTSGIPDRGCWTCPYCTGLTIDKRVKNADVIKLKFKTFKGKMQDQMESMQRAVDLLEDDQQ